MLYKKQQYAVGEKVYKLVLEREEKEKFPFNDFAVKVEVIDLELTDTGVTPKTVYSLVYNFSNYEEALTEYAKYNR